MTHTNLWTDIVVPLWTTVSEHVLAHPYFYGWIISLYALGAMADIIVERQNATILAIRDFQSAVERLERQR